LLSGPKYCALSVLERTFVEYKALLSHWRQLGEGGEEDVARTQIQETIVPSKAG